MPTTSVRGTMLVCLAATAVSCGGQTVRAPATRSEEPIAITGVHWRLQKAQGPGASTVFPSTIDGWLEETATGAVTGSDGCALFSANSNAVDDRLRLSRVTQSTNGCVSDHGPLDAMRHAVNAALLSGHDARVAVTPGTPAQLVLRGSGYTLTYVDEGPSTHGDQPSRPETSKAR